MSATPQYASTVKTPSVTISTANTNLDGTGTLGTLMTGGTAGSRIDIIHCVATAATTNGMLRFFIDSALIAEVPVTAVTPSGTVPAWSAVVKFDGGITLGSGKVLKAGTHNAESFAITAINAGDF